MKFVQIKDVKLEKDDLSMKTRVISNQIGPSSDTISSASYY